MPPTPMTGRLRLAAHGIISSYFSRTKSQQRSTAAPVTLSARLKASVTVTAPIGTETDSTILRSRTSETSMEAPPRSNCR